MKTRTRIIIATLTVLLVSIACIFPGCSSDKGFIPTVKNVVNDNTALLDQGVVMVNEYQKASANYALKVSACYALMDRNTATLQSYATANNQNIESWTGNFKEQKAELAKQLEAYKAAGGDPTKLNLEEMMKNGALPGDLQKSMGLYISAVVQAPPPANDSALWAKVLDTQTECYTSIEYVGTVANDKATQYNNWRGSLEGKIVGNMDEFLTQINAKIGFNLPESLPLITGGVDANAPLH